MQPKDHTHSPPKKVATGFRSFSFKYFGRFFFEVSFREGIPKSGMSGLLILGKKVEQLEAEKPWFSSGKFVELEHVRDLRLPEINVALSFNNC